MLSQNLKIFDAHFHIVDDSFPLVPNNGFIPETFTCEDYLNRMKGYTLCGGAIVSGSFQAFDQSYLVNALKRLGSSFVGVTQLPAQVSDQELQELNNAGVRAIRFNLKRGGSEEIRHLDSMARRVHEVVGWHVELYVDSKELIDLYEILIDLPAVSIDHLSLTKEGFTTLIKLAEHGVHVKATGFGRVNFDDVSSAINDLYRANPRSLMFGTDHPSTRAPRPYLDIDYALIMETLGEEKANNVFFKNAAEFYNAHCTS